MFGRLVVCLLLAAALRAQAADEDLEQQVRELRKNVSELWTFVKELRSAVSGHLVHLRVHQAALESSVHAMEHRHEHENSLGSLHDHHHYHGDESHSHSGEEHSHGSGHSHSGEQHTHGSGHSHSGEQHSYGGSHSHSGEQHSHGDSHSHSGEQHSHGGSHSHSWEQHSHGGGHSHSGEQHSHGGDHSHSGEQYSHGSSHSHSGEQHSHGHYSNSAEHHSHSTGTKDHSNEQGQHSHKNSHENDDPVPARSGSSLDLMNGLSFHSHSHHNRQRNRTVEIPQYADYNKYDFAVCEMSENSVIRGHATFWQRKSGGKLNVHVRLQGFGNGRPGRLHGLHVHSPLGDFGEGCASAGAHYDPKGAQHGAPNALVRHVGDFGNIECDERGETNLAFSDDVATLTSPYSIVGKVLVVHFAEDDLGLGGDYESQKSGNSGEPLSCCAIQKVDKLAIRHFKALKLAKERRTDTLR